MSNFTKEQIKEKLVLALDVETIEEAKELIDELNPYIGTFKVGLQLFCGYGLEIVNYMKEKNANFFLDVKLHDIPNTVEKASYNVIKNGANFFNVHATGGIEMMKAAKAGAYKAYEKYNTKKPIILAVTVLTSISDDILKPKSMKIIVFILTVLFYFVVNGLLFSEDVIQELFDIDESEENFFSEASKTGRIIALYFSTS